MRSTLKLLIAALTCTIVTGISLSAQNFHMVKDVNDSKDGSPLNNGFPVSYNYNLPFAVLKNIAYFSANDGIHGNEVWRSDGTAAGTYMLKDINGAAANSNPSQLVASGKYVYFKGSDGIHGTELWRTNGTTTGTVMVKDITPGTDDPALNYLTNVNGTLFFADNDGTNGNELMRSDGTAVGTMVIKDVTPGSAYSAVSYIVNVNGKAFYFYSSGIDSLTGLYKSDGTAPGTIRLTVPGNNFNYTTAAAVGTKLFFVGNDYEPWISNGTVAGTHLIKAINPDNYGSYPTNFTAMNGIAYFSATDQIHGTELWRSDGTKAGTYLVKDINPGISNASLSLFTAVDSTLFFLTTNVSGNTDLWKSNGTDAGTVLVKSFGTGFLAPALCLTNINGVLFFEGYTAAKGYEMWRSDGTTAGTVLIKDIYSGIYGSSAFSFTPLNGKILFSANDGNTGTELWISDGTMGNASLLKDINQTATADGLFYWGITPFNNKIYFIASTQKSGAELWATDGTVNNTKQVTDIQPGSLTGVKTTISKLLSSSNKLYFEAGNLKYGNELWSLNGDSSALVKDLTPGREGTTFPEQYFHGNKKTFCNVDSMVLFVSGANETQLWKTTGQGAVLLKEGNQISALTLNKKDIYFAINSGELWKTNGLVAGTVKLNNAHLPYSFGSIPSVVSYKNRIYYQAADHTTWVTDGTDAGTIFFKNINPQFDAPVNFVSATNVVLNNTLFFAASDGLTGLELWKTDGTAAGTVLVKDISAGAGSAFTDEYRTGYFTRVDSIFYFLADDNIHGIELWKTDGTSNGTVMVKDITPGNQPTQISSVTQVGNKLAFLVYDYSLQKEVLWQSDGTEAGTHTVNDANLANVTIVDYFNNALVGNNNTLYFTGYTSLYGNELWAGILNDNLRVQQASVTNGLLNKKNAQLDNLSFVVQPNPVISDFKLRVINTQEEQDALVQIVNASGAVILSERMHFSKSNNFLHYNAALWPAGIYSAKIVLNDGSAKEIKIIKE